MQHSLRLLERHAWKASSGATLHKPRLCTRAVQCQAGAPQAGGVQAAPRAAALVIGNEILSGSITDTNTPFLAKLLYSRGVDLVRVEFVPDVVEDIQDSLHRLRQRVGPAGAVVTSGGIGPTHDDVTYEAVAGALGTRLARHAPTVALMEQHYRQRGVELNAARLRMAELPEGAEVLMTEGLWVPLAVLHGVYVLPGIPRLFRQMLTAHKQRFRGPAHVSRTLFTHLGEGDVAAPLAAVAAEHPAVSIGSYPADTETGPHRVKLQVEGRDAAAVEQAAAAIAACLPTVPLT